MSTSDDYSIMLSNLLFKNIEFSLKGNLLNFNHLMSQSVQVIGSKFVNLSKSKISINSFSTNSELSTKVSIINSTASNINMEFGSFIYLETGAEISITNSNFSGVSSLQEGAVLRASSDATTVTISNSVFTQNTALKGGVLLVESQSYIKATNCSFTENYANEGGVIASDDDGNFDAENCIFSKNYAMNGLVANMFVSSKESQIINSSITYNEHITKDELLNELESCDIL